MSLPEQVDNENDEEDLEPHSVSWFIVPGLAGSGATHGVDVTGEPLRRGIASLEAHACGSLHRARPRPRRARPTDHAPGGRPTPPNAR